MFAPINVQSHLGHEEQIRDRNSALVMPIRLPLSLKRTAHGQGVLSVETYGAEIWGLAKNRSLDQPKEAREKKRSYRSKFCLQNRPCGIGNDLM